jgi:ATP-dependent Clp protease, protease subunit
VEQKEPEDVDKSPDELARKVRLDRTVYINGPVNDDMAIVAIQQIEDLDVTDGTIRVVLDSEGGEEQPGYHIYDVITMCRNRVEIEGYGSVMSIAAVIFQAGEVRRLSPNTLFMIHNGVIAEKIKLQDEVLAQAELIKQHNKRYYKILADASGQTQERIQELCKAETYLLAHEALRFGFADEIIQPLKRRGPRKRSRK